MFFLCMQCHRIDLLWKLVNGGHITAYTDLLYQIFGRKESHFRKNPPIYKNNLQIPWVLDFMEEFCIIREMVVCMITI